MSARTRLLGTVLATTALAVGSTVLPAGAAEAPKPTVSRGYTIPSFYDAPDPASLPAANGALVRSEPLKLALTLPGINKPLPGNATRIMYKSTDFKGRPVGVTGSYLEPAAKWPGKGPRPVVVLAPGTMGQGDQCGLSLGLQIPVLFGSGTAAVSYEILAMYRLLEKGVSVIQTDYVGMGNTDRLHTYVARLDQGHAVLDAVRAVRQMPGSTVTTASPVGLYGYSQGGGATASAAELQASYAPDVKLKATYSGAAPADLTEVIKGIDGSELVGAIAWAVNGFVQSDPTLQPIFDRYTTAAGKALLKDLGTMCVGDAIAKYAYQKSSTWTTTGESVSQIAAKEPKVQQILESNRIGKLRPSGLIRVATGVNDNLVPHSQTRKMAVEWCKLGGDVVYTPIDTPNVGSRLVNHFMPLLADQGTAIDWLGGALAGKQTPSNCGKINSLK